MKKTGEEVLYAEGLFRKNMHVQGFKMKQNRRVTEEHTDISQLTEKFFFRHRFGRNTLTFCFMNAQCDEFSWHREIKQDSEVEYMVGKVSNNYQILNSINH